MKKTDVITKPSKLDGVRAVLSKIGVAGNDGYRSQRIWDQKDHANLIVGPIRS